MLREKGRVCQHTLRSSQGCHLQHFTSTRIEVTQFLTTYFLKRNYTVASAQDHRLANSQETTGKEES